MCPKCGGLLDTVFDSNALANYSKRRLESSQASMWKFRMFLPVRPSTVPVSAGEGNTPLRVAKSFQGNVWVKDETRNPTGSFKDRGASLAVTRLSQLGVKNVVLGSEGNAGCSFALYSNMVRTRCRIYVPQWSNPAKVNLSKQLGAKVTRVAGTIADAGLRAAQSSRKTGDYNASTFVTPYRHDGKGTMALEICQQLGWRSPDFVVYPLGGGVGLVGMWKMFKTLHRIGWLDSTPRLVAVQPSGCAPLVDAYNKRKRDVKEWKSPRTVALGLKIPKPLAGKWTLQCLRESKGLALTVTDTEILESMHEVARKEGLLVEPSSAATFAALPHLYEDHLVERRDEVVVVATGSGLKTLEQF